METIDFTDLKTIVEINSWTGNKDGVDLSGMTMQKWLKPLGFNVEVFHREKVGNHLLFTTPQQNNASRVLLLGHLDTVFPPGIFEHFREDEEWVYGPGTCDMKGGNFVALSALRNLYQTHGQIRNIDVLLVSDEETGSDDSKFVTRQLAHHYDACIDFEAAGPEHEVVTGRKGVATYRIELTGIAAHAGNNYHLGKNANLAAAKLLIALDALTRVEQGTTVNVGKIKGGISTNTISPGAELMVEARFTHLKEQERVLTTIPELIHQHGVEGVTATIEGGLQRDVMTPSPKQQALLDNFATILGYSLKTEQRGGVSDANIMAGAGVPTLDGFGPFGDGDHTELERASKDSFCRRIKEITAILEHYSQAE